MNHNNNIIHHMKMGLKKLMIVFLALIIIIAISSSSSSSSLSLIQLSEATQDNIFDVSTLNRSSFPHGFLFGATSAAYQFEGATTEGGRGPSIWDNFTHKYPEKIKDHSNGDVAIDQYHRYKEDIAIMKNMNFDAYRFSISWTRILPNGKLSGGINSEGIKYYNNLINELLANGLTPFVTLFHWDLPQTLEVEYGGFLSPHIVKDFKDFVEVCFKEFGDRVKHWVTLNEPWSYSFRGYASGEYAPGRCSQWLELNCTGGNSGTEPYLVSHHLLLAHAVAVQLYRTKFQAFQKGTIGITMISHWFVPLSETKEDEEAASRSVDFMLGWFLDPVTNGDYPQIMRQLVGSRLPKFTVEQSKLLKSSFDFIGINYYTANYASNAPSFINASQPQYQTDFLANLTTERDGEAIGPRSASYWLYIYPRGIRDLVLYVKTKYNNPLIYITENGVDEFNDPTIPLEKALIDTFRIDYYHQHLYYINSAIKDGVNIKGYFMWSLMDNFEWAVGYTVRFGVNFVDYKNDNKRYPKLSAQWFKNFLEYTRIAST